MSIRDSQLPSFRSRKKVRIRADGSAHARSRRSEIAVGSFSRRKMKFHVR
jgi:hypothetical protein